MVTNTGTDDLRDIRLDDALAEMCSTRNNSTVNLAGRFFTNQSNNRVDVTVSGAGNNSDEIFQPGERIVYFCNGDPTDTAYTNTVSVSGTGVNS